jgi:hypothetical protein
MYDFLLILLLLPHSSCSASLTNPYTLPNKPIHPKSALLMTWHDMRRWGGRDQALHIKTYTSSTSALFFFPVIPCHELAIKVSHAVPCAVTYPAQSYPLSLNHGLRWDTANAACSTQLPPIPLDNVFHLRAGEPPLLPNPFTPNIIHLRALPFCCDIGMRSGTSTIEHPLPPLHQCLLT